jgi:hypothetical protein
MDCLSGKEIKLNLGSMHRRKDRATAESAGPYKRLVNFALHLARMHLTSDMFVVTIGRWPASSVPEEERKRAGR